MAGRQPQVDVYDDISLKRVQSLGKGAHQNRLFCVKFDPNNSNVLWSGGWDCQVVGWDLRLGKPFQQI